MEKLAGDRVVEAARQALADGTGDEPRRLLRWAHGLLGERLMMSTGFGKSGMAILHMVKDELPEVPVYFIDTGFHFPETLEYLERLRESWKVRIVVQRPRVYGVEFVRRFGEKLYERDPDLCCHKNKVEPFRELFGRDGRYQGWITGVRRDQSSSRSDAEPIEVVEDDLLKVQPLAHWTRKEVEEYIARHSIPLHPFFSDGYTSIGCAPCTARNREDPANERAGRWAGKAKTECGLHTFWKRSGAAPASDASVSGNGVHKAAPSPPSRELPEGSGKA